MVVAGDVAGIDVNCGCPKRFSLISGMGAALLSEPERLINILTSLVKKIPIPITCKIRMIPQTDDMTSTQTTINFMQRLEETGIKAIGLHCRFKNDKRQFPGRWEIFAPVVRAIRIPVIANGDIFTLEDAKRLKELSGVSSVMLARAAEQNPSIFRKEGPLPRYEILKEYVRTAVQYNMPFHNAKYCVLIMWPTSAGKEFREKLVKSKTYVDLCGALDMMEFYEDVVASQLKRAAELCQTDRLLEDETGELGTDCPYIPIAAGEEEVECYGMAEWTSTLEEVEMKTKGLAIA
ncbi:tRNA-dihydrouridine(20) synthase [NAD(P)+]-like [Borealophlyctis nickersoniae]|nr:tRNA-dihydrouridine(20) synthase [NAD(P)+]-like [Borealophlyctis nickersoniae]